MFADRCGPEPCCVFVNIRVAAQAAFRVPSRCRDPKVETMRLRSAKVVEPMNRPINSSLNANDDNLQAEPQTRRFSRVMRPRRRRRVARGEYHRNYQEFLITRARQGELPKAVATGAPSREAVARPRDSATRRALVCRAKRMNEETTTKYFDEPKTSGADLVAEPLLHPLEQLARSKSPPSAVSELPHPNG